MVVGLSVDYSQLIVAFTPKAYSFKVKPGGEPQFAYQQNFPYWSGY